MADNKIKIIHTPVRFYPYMGGVEHSTYHLCRELIKMGCNIEVICAKTSSNESNNIGGIVVRRLKSFFKITNTNITLTLPFEILKSKFDVMHTHMPTPWSADISILMGKLMGKKTVITIHNDMDKTGFFSKMISEVYLHTIFLLSLYLVDRIIIINEEWEKSFSNTHNVLKKFKNKISIAPNGVNSKLFKPLNLPRNKNTILFISILDKSHKFKGLDYLLESLISVRKTHPDVTLWIIGGGDDKNFYIRKTKKLGLAKNVKFLGQMRQSDLSSYYNKACMLVLPSTSQEGFGNVLLEANSCEIPVITTGIVGIAKEIQQYKCGLIVKIKDSTQLAHAIVKLLDDPILRKSMGGNGRKLIKSKYNWEGIANTNISVYKEILNK